MQTESEMSRFGVWMTNFSVALKHTHTCARAYVHTHTPTHTIP